MKILLAVGVLFGMALYCGADSTYLFVVYTASKTSADYDAMVAEGRQFSSQPSMRSYWADTPTNKYRFLAITTDSVKVQQKFEAAGGAYLYRRYDYPTQGGDLSVADVLIKPLPSDFPLAP